ncbi:Plexin-B-like 3 [Homarus americanus]|uniref:Plexin-B-like 3 n=1 Tax=Homarus americanus TaxID=6706 RepID=A0A8J5K3J3_HOMAM|nr:Plexin-B-like 3 [Homarus americanus]
MDIQPLAGPLEGGTLVTIEGSNLGLREEDVQENVFIGDVPCHVHDYRVSVRITCRTSPAPMRHGEPGSADLQFPVRVSTPAGTTKSTVKFTYTNVTVTGVWPTHGPVSGGTVLSISGRFLNVGSHVSAKLDDLPCVVNKTQSSSHRLVCVTSRASASEDGSKEGESVPRVVRTLTVTVDGAHRTLASPFTYTPDPRILELKPLRSPWGGGRLVTVHGTHLDAIQAPRITVNLFERVLNSSACRVLSIDQMECPSPPLDRDAVLAILEAHDSVRRRRRSRNRRSHKAQRSPRRRDHDGDEVAVDVGFVMDDVASVLHLRKHFPDMRSRLTYMTDPRYYPFPHGVKLYKGDTLVVEGEHINDAADESDVRVTIGGSVCNVTSLAATQLVCTPPELQPDPTDEKGVSTPERLPLVVVHVGQYLRFPLGVLRYERHRRFPLTPEGIAGLAGGALFLVLASFVVLAVYRRKSSQAERVYKLMQLQMDSLESHVRTECKQAFAELQTDMTDLTADLESSGIPTLDHRSYVMKVFFPGVTDHPILNDPKVRPDHPILNDPKRGRRVAGRGGRERGGVGGLVGRDGVVDGLVEELVGRGGRLGRLVGRDDGLVDGLVEEVVGRGEGLGGLVGRGGEWKGGGSRRQPTSPLLTWPIPLLVPLRLSIPVNSNRSTSANPPVRATYPIYTCRSRLLAYRLTLNY